MTTYAYKITIDNNHNDNIHTQYRNPRMWYIH